MRIFTFSQPLPHITCKSIPTMLKRLLLCLTISVFATSTLAATMPDRQLGPATLLLTPDTSVSSPYVFHDAPAALAAINNSGLSNMTLLVEPSVYWLDDPDDPAIRRNPDNSGNVPFAVELSCDTLSIIGLADNPADVVFAVNRGQTQGALGNFTMLHFKGHSLSVENMTFGNYCNVDLDYPRNPKLNRPKRREAIVQAQLGICDGTDRLFARNCRFISRLNLCPFVGSRRSLYKDCYFECTDDALTGSAIYLDCRFTFHSGKPFYSTASTGAVFLNCDIHTLVNGTQYLTKMPGMVTMIDTRFTSDNPVTLQWTRDASPLRCYQSNVTLNGTPIRIDSSRPELSADITASPLLRAYKVTTNGQTVYNTPNLLAGDDGWDPLGILPLIQKAERELNSQLTSLPVALCVSPSTKILAPQSDTLQLTASPRLWGDYPASISSSPKTINWSSPTTLTLLKAGQQAVAASANTYPKDMPCLITATTPEGLVGATSVTVSAYLKDAPEFASAPKLTPEKAALKLDYTLPESYATDDSYIVWYRSTRPDFSDTIAVRHGRGSVTAVYPLTRADENRYISAVITPKLSDTKAGLATTLRFDGPVSSKMLRSLSKKEKQLTTTFAEIPISRNEPGTRGLWNFDTFKPADTYGHDWKPDTSMTCSWYYGKGADAATGTGLVQATRGARLSYTPMRPDCRNMKISLVAEPAKGPGQGFGSATGQYMDICIKFDPVSLSGYALRIERTPLHDKAVTFTLVRYDGGTVSPVSKSVASNCYRTPCDITLELRGNTLTATARTSAPAVTPSSPEIQPSVTLTTDVIPTAGNTSFAIQHTGTVGSSATLLRDLHISWD